MGTVLYTPSYPEHNAEFAIPRYHCAALAIQWNNPIVISGWPNIHLKETVFGGFEAFITMHNWIQPFSRKTFTLGNMFETLYVTPPGGGTPISAGVCPINWHIDPGFRIPVCVLVLGGIGPYWFFPTPPAPSSYWQPAIQAGWPDYYHN